MKYELYVIENLSGEVQPYCGRVRRAAVDYFGFIDRWSVVVSTCGAFLAATVILTTW